MHLISLRKTKTKASKSVLSTIYILIKCMISKVIKILQSVNHSLLNDRNISSFCFLFSNHLMVLPDTPLGLKELKRLDISHNQLDCIPENCLHACSKLEILEASFNYISKLRSHFRFYS